MKYWYYPGCSLESSAREYGQSTERLLGALGAELAEIPGWNCCGATAAQSASHLLSLALPARNLALAEKEDPERDILVPCSACYLNMKRAAVMAEKDPDFKKQMNGLLEHEDLSLKGKVRVRHLLDVLVADFGAEAVSALRKRELAGLRIAPYYGCQCLRPYTVFDDPERPTSMEGLIEATGAEVHAWDMGGVCCGASHMTTKPEAGLVLVEEILKDAKGADAIVTVCPMCQMNLEAYQKKISRHAGAELEINVLYLPQLLGAALGLSQEDLGLSLNLALEEGLAGRLAPAAPASEAPAG